MALRRSIATRDVTPAAFRLGLATVLVAVLLLHYPALPGGVADTLSVSYATLEGQVSIDSYYMTALADLILAHGEAGWVVHPASLFGLYPGSYPSGVPHLLAGVAMASGVGVPAAVFIVALAIAVALPILAAAVVFSLGGNRASALLAAALIGTAPLLVYNTRWVDPKRVLIVASYLLVLWMLVRAEGAPRARRYGAYAAVGALIVIAATVHRFFLVLVLLVGAYGALKLTRPLRERLPRAGFAWPVARGAAVAALGLVPFLFPSFFLGKVFTESYETGALYAGEGWTANLVNLVVSTAGGAGPVALLFGAVGVVLVLAGRDGSPRRDILFAALLALLPLLTVRMYVRFVIAAYLAIVAAVGLQKVFASRPRAIVAAVAVTLIVGSPVALAMSGHWMETLASSGVGGDDPFAAPDEIEAAAFLASRTPEGATFIAANWLQGMRVQAASGVPNAPVVVGSPLVTNVLAFDLTNRPLEVRAVGADEILQGPGTKTLFLVDGADSTLDVMVHKDYTWIMNHRPSDGPTQRLLDDYRVAFVVVDKNFPDRYTNWHSAFLTRSPFLEAIADSSMPVFENDAIAVYEVPA